MVSLRNCSLQISGRIITLEAFEEPGLLLSINQQLWSVNHPMRKNYFEIAYHILAFGVSHVKLLQSICVDRR